MAEAQAEPASGDGPGGSVAAQVFQGIWFIAVGAFASLLGPGAVIALSGGIGTVIAVVLAARWAARTMPVTDRT